MRNSALASERCIVLLLCCFILPDAYAAKAHWLYYGSVGEAAATVLASLSFDAHRFHCAAHNRPPFDKQCKWSDGGQCEQR